MSAATPLGALRRQRLVQYFFFGVFLIILYQLLALLSPFFIAVLGAAILALMVHPLHERLRSWLGRPQLAAALTTVVALLLIVLPFMLLGWAFLKDAARLYPTAREWLADVRALSTGQTRLQGGAFVEGLRRVLAGLDVDLQEVVLKNLAELRGTVLQLAASALTNTLFMLFNVLLLAFTLFFFLRDGEEILGRLVELVPMAPEHKEAILARLRDTLLELARGVLGLAVVQGVLNGVGFALIGVPLPALLGMLTTVLSPIPFLGPLGVLVPIGLGAAMSGSTASGALAAVWCVGVAVLVERVLRPILVRPENEIPVLLLFFGLLGGVRVYGLIGVLLGPVLIALTLAFIKVYRKEYHWLLSQEGP